ncbi:MAG: glycogen debranching N-terminal domain-containing protein [Acidobacteriaceae bacterium]
MSRVASSSASKHAGLQKAPAPTEPHIAYPEPHLSNVESLALIRGKTFSTSNHKGNIMPPGAPHVGFFVDDTRYLSELDLCINGFPPIVLSCSTEGAYGSRIELTVKGSIESNGLDLPVNTIYVHREQLLESDVLYDVIHFESFHQERTKLSVEIAYDADFMDIFQVRGIVRGKSGHYYEPIVMRDSMSFIYEGLDKRVRTTTVSFAPEPAKIKDKTAHWEVDLEPLGKARITAVVRAHSEMGQSPSRAAQKIEEHSLVAFAYDNDLRKPLARLREEFEQWRKDCTRFHSDNGIFNAMLETSTEDFYALQMSDIAGTAVAAGVPWFAALFGRDSLIASFQSLILNPTLAQGTLRALASYQGDEVRDDRDEEPGKILHEMRSGEMTETGEVAFGMNYGSVDATPLFLILLGEYYRWTGDEDLLRGLAKNISLAVKWLLTYADLAGNGLIEYRRKTSKGLFNQGWKDSGDANMHADGSIAQPPIALIEVQGYAIKALAEAAFMLELLGDEELKAQAEDRSEKIRRLLDPMFWMEEKNYYAMALDKDKRRLEVIASNPGHLLFSGAITQEKAKLVVNTLLEGGLFSGWGIRTLSHREATYNPMSYHRGSVWPHDNSIIGYGMASYGFRKEASRVFTALYDAALYFRDYRLPELFCGIQRRDRDEPVYYPVSCSPQAWASGAPLLLLTAVLGLHPNALRGELNIVNPQLPEFLNFLRMENFRVGNSRVTLEFQRHDDRTSCGVIGIEGDPVAVSVAFT